MLQDAIFREIEEYIFVEGEPQKADVIFVPGNGFPQMAERAAKLYREGFAPFVLPSGRYSVTLGKFVGVQQKIEVYHKDYRTEWEFLKDVLMMNGVPEKAILKEDCATYTYENAVNSRKVTDREGIEVRKAILCCRNYHARRALKYYQLLYPETEFYVSACDLDGIRRDNWRETEAGIDAVMGEVSRIAKQFGIYMK
ncbi:MAG: YdcF family protein [Eubacteriales bacterium]|nr:YdcF family protein [Eubacteriales bacterium]